MDARQDEMEVAEARYLMHLELRNHWRQYNMLILNSIWAMLHNQKLNRWHPILFQEAPFPGPDDGRKLCRH